MPGDSITQKITVKNDSSKDVKVKIYMRSLGAVNDTADFLSKLHLTVGKSSYNKMEYMFDAAANETDGLTDWVLLGTLYSGGVVNLELTLDVPIELDNEFQDAVGYINWQFKIEEFPVEETDPQPPPTGDNSLLYICIAVISLVGLIMIFLPILKRRRQSDDN